MENHTKSISHGKQQKIHVAWKTTEFHHRKSISHEKPRKSISHGKSHKMHFVSNIFYTSRCDNHAKICEDYVTHVRWIYLITGLNIGKVRMIHEV